EVVDSSGEDAEVSALENAEVAKNDVAAILETDGLVANVRVFGAQSRPGAFRKSLAIEEAGTENADVLETLAPDQAVVKVAVAVVLIFVELHRFGVVVAPGSGGRRGVG